MNKHPIECEVTIVHEDAVRRAKETSLEAGVIDSLELFFKVFADGTRLRILSALRTGELCVCDICAALSLKQSTVSQQLRLLRQMRVVKSRQEGRSVYYSINDDHIEKIFIMGIDHVSE